VRKGAGAIRQADGRKMLEGRRPALFPGSAAQAVADVVENAQVGKQREVLKNQADAAPGCGRRAR
jgi:hypothetical protein